MGRKESKSIKNYKVTKPALFVGPSLTSQRNTISDHHRHTSKMPFRAIIGTPAKWRFPGGSMIAHFKWYFNPLLLSNKKKNEKKITVGHSLTSLSGSAQVPVLPNGSISEGAYRSHPNLGLHHSPRPVYPKTYCHYIYSILHYNLYRSGQVIEEAGPHWLSGRLLD